MKLNCDLGEGLSQCEKGADEKIMPHIDLANIACGFHAGDPETMAATIKLAIKAGVTIGAHPGYPDLIGFGRRCMHLEPAQLIASIQYQVGALQALAKAQNTNVCYVKAHGALYNDMMKNTTIFDSVCQAVAQLDNTLVIMLQALPDMSHFIKIAQKYGLCLWFEAFADRNYQDNGLLVNRSNKNAVITDINEVCQRIMHYQATGELLSENGIMLPLRVDTFCVHGDNDKAVELVRHINAILVQ